MTPLDCAVLPATELPPDSASGPVSQASLVTVMTLIDKLRSFPETRVAAANPAEIAILSHPKEQQHTLAIWTNSSSLERQDAGERGEKQVKIAAGRP